MSLKGLLMPAIAGRLLARERVESKRRRLERARANSGKPHLVHYFHQVDDPYSALLAQVLPGIIQRYDIRVVAHVVPPPVDAAAPERDKLVAYSRRDAQLLARRWGLDFDDTGVQPDAAAVQMAACALVGAAAAGCFLESAAPVSQALWHRLPVSTAYAAGPQATQLHMAQSAALRRRLGHYLGACLFYAGEWYWGIDRLHHLEQRLKDLGASRQPEASLLFPLAADRRNLVSATHSAPIEFFFSFRSPYSAIVAPRVFQLGKAAGVPVKLRYVLPMVMRGLPVRA